MGKELGERTYGGAHFIEQGVGFGAVRKRLLTRALPRTLRGGLPVAAGFEARVCGRRLLHVKHPNRATGAQSIPW
jgi:hypothetical protein